MEILTHPVTAIFLCLMLGAVAVSGKFSRHAANFLLTAAWAVGVFGIMRAGIRDIRIIGILVCVVTAIGLFTSWWIRPGATDSSATNSISGTQKQLEEINEFICQKSELELREEFDFPQMLKYNIKFAKRNLAPQLVSSDDSAAIDQFFLNGQARLDLRYAKIKNVNNRADVEWIRGKVGVVNTSKKYVERRKALSRLASSATLPPDVTAALRMLDDSVEKDSALMIDSLNGSLAADPRNILEDDVYGTERYGSASGAYWKKFIPLRPAADVIANTVGKALRP